jgi:hypothetical protein
MRDWSSFDDIPMPASLSGFSSVTLEGIYAKYCGRGTQIATRRRLFMLMSYAKQYPTVRVQANRVGGCAKGFGFEVTKVTAGFKYLASVVNELEEPIACRHEVHNTIPHVFTASVVGSIDTFPWRVQRRKGYMRQRILYAGKYKCHVLKFQAVIDNTGNWLWFSGPHVGSSGDGSLWKDQRPPFLTQNPGEKTLGDKAYCGRIFLNSLQVIAPIKKPPGGQRTRVQSAYNYVQAFYRVKVEHAFGYLKRFNILSDRYRGRLDAARIRKVRDIMKVLIHLTQFKKNQEPYRMCADCLV